MKSGSLEREGAATIGVREAAALVGRHPETVRRWVWSGRLKAIKSGNRLQMSPADVKAAAGAAAEPRITLAEWAEEAARLRASYEQPHDGGASALEILLEERWNRP